jgi:hypothetical protein
VDQIYLARGITQWWLPVNMQQGFGFHKREGIFGLLIDF